MLDFDNKFNCRRLFGYSAKQMRAMQLIAEEIRSEVVLYSRVNTAYDPTESSDLSSFTVSRSSLRLRKCLVKFIQTFDCWVSDYIYYSWVNCNTGSRRTSETSLQTSESRGESNTGGGVCLKLESFMIRHSSDLELCQVWWCLEAGAVLKEKFTSRT